MHIFKTFNNTFKQSQGTGKILKLYQLFVEGQDITKKKKIISEKRKFKKQNALEVNNPMNPIK